MESIGCDFHPGYQQIAMLDLVTGELVEKALSHERKEQVRAFSAAKLRAFVEQFQLRFCDQPWPR